MYICIFGKKEININNVLIRQGHSLINFATHSLMQSDLNFFFKFSLAKYRGGDGGDTGGNEEGGVEGGRRDNSLFIMFSISP